MGSTYMMPVKDTDQLICPGTIEKSCYCTFVRSSAHNKPFSNRFKSVKSFEKCTYIKHSHFVSIVTNPWLLLRKKQKKRVDRRHFLWDPVKKMWPRFNFTY